MSHILVVEDEPFLARLLSRVLRSHGFRTTETATGAAGLDAAITLRPDLVILDLMLPDMRGEQVLTELIAAYPDSKVIVLSSVVQVATRVHVLDCGAVDYMAKPFAHAELVARVRLHLRGDGTGHRAREHHLRGAGLEVDIQRRELLVGGRRVELTPRESLLLSYLLQRTPAICTRVELLAGVWGLGADGNTNVVDVYVKRLRLKLPTDKIQTVRNIGYRLVG